jgi:hypothetical protein
MILGEMYGRTTVRPIVDTATSNAISTNLGRRCVVVAIAIRTIGRTMVRPYIGSSASMVVAMLTLRAISFVSTPLRSVPTHIHRPYLRRCRGSCDCRRWVVAAVAIVVARLQSRLYRWNYPVRV